ncbi:MAG: right-handed parallel beta-helix repeat-containing protein [Acidobacteriota bacterium]
MMRVAWLALGLLVGPLAGAQSVIYVDATATGSDNGASWNDAFVSLSAALAASSSGQEIWVARGTYSPGTSALSTFQLVSDVSVYGGFDGSETLRAERDPAANVTTLSGLVGGARKAYHVVSARFVNGAILDGFTIEGGDASSATPDRAGAGLYVGAGIVVANCVFRFNVAEIGGAVWQGGTIVDCLFEQNTATTGGAVSDAFTLERCTFRNNNAAWGGAVASSNQFACNVRNCTFEQNAAGNAGGGAVLAGGMAIGCVFQGNTAPEGGGLYLVTEPQIGFPVVVNATFRDNRAQSGAGVAIVDPFGQSGTTLAGCTFVSNVASLTGGGILHDAPVTTTLASCSFSGNVAASGGGAVMVASGSVTAVSSVFWGDPPAELGVASGTLVVTYCDVQGGYAGAGNVNGDPLYRNAALGDLRLSAGSPCIDAGDSGSISPDLVDLDADGDTVEPTPYDHDGVARFADDPATPDTGAGPPPIVDMGAHEVAPVRQGNIVGGGGLGYPNPDRVRVFDGSGAPTTTDFFSNGSGTWGTNVSAGDIDGPLDDEILTGPGPGPVHGPHVRAWRGDGTPLGKVSFFAYGTLRYGVNASAGDVDGDGYDEILTGAGPGPPFGPHVRGFDFDGVSVRAIAKLSFHAYGTLKYGANLSGGALDGDPYDEILTGPGPGAAFGPLVRGWNFDGQGIATIGKISFWPFTVLQYGVLVAAGDVDADGFGEILASPGPGPSSSFPARFVGYDFDGTAVTPLPGCDATPFPTFYGGTVGASDVAATGAEAIVAGAGRDPAASSEVRAYLYLAGALAAALPDFVPFPASGYGVEVAGADLGF